MSAIMKPRRTDCPARQRVPSKAVPVCTARGGRGAERAEWPDRRGVADGTPARGLEDVLAPPASAAMP